MVVLESNVRKYGTIQSTWRGEKRTVDDKMTKQGSMTVGRKHQDFLNRRVHCFPH